VESRGRETSLQEATGTASARFLLDGVWRRAPGWPRHEAVLLDSPFPRLERISVIERRATPVERFVDRALSLSSVSHDLTGGRADDLSRKMREAMTGLAKDGLMTEVVKSEALIARR
jgi:hypothetical protein